MPKSGTKCGEMFRGCPACQGVTNEHSYGYGCRLMKHTEKQ